MKQSLGRIALGLLEGVARAAGNYIVERVIDQFEARAEQKANAELARVTACKACGRALNCPACGEVKS